LLDEGGKTNLQDLSLEDTSITNKGWMHLKGLKNLKTLTNVSDIDWKQFEGYPNLSLLNLINTEVGDVG
jgi:hypothetical protein